MENSPRPPISNGNPIINAANQQQHLLLTSNPATPGTLNQTTLSINDLDSIPASYTTGPSPPNSPAETPHTADPYIHLFSHHPSDELPPVHDLGIGPTRTLSILLINARSLVPKFHHLLQICATASPTIICITETWLTHSTPNATINLPGYDIHRNDRLNRSQTTGGGCLLYTKTELSAQTILDPNIQTTGDAVWISCCNCNPTILIGCIYIPPSQVSESIPRLCEILSHVQAFPQTLKLLMGDFNMPNISWSTLNCPPRYTPFLNQLTINGWSQHVTQPTRGGNVLDLILSHGDTHITTRVGKEFPHSDHKMVTCTVSLVGNKHPPANRSFFPLTEPILEAYALLIRNSDWDKFFLSHDVQNASDIFYENTIRSLHLACPPKNIPTNRTNTRPQLLPLDKKIKHHHTNYLRSGNISSLLTLHRLNLSRSQKLIALERHEEHNAINHANRNRQISRLFRRRCLTNEECITLIISNGSPLTSPLEISNCLNTYFASCYKPANPSAVPPISTNSPNPSPANRTLHQITPTLSDVAANLRRIKPSTIPGPDGLPPSLLKVDDADTPTLVLNLFTLSLSLGFFPTQWKQSIIIPRFKTGPHTSVSSYRGIHHTCVLSRTIERIVQRPLVELLLANNAISHQQYGFLSKRSVMSCQLDFFNHVSTAINAGQAIVIIFLDIQKAFDQVPHPILLQKLQLAGVQGPLLHWFESYLADRSQRTLIGSSLSDPLPITSGVVQGSVLGPILFLLYINNILLSILHGCPYLFADDIKIIYTFSPDTAEAALAKIQSDLDSLALWSDNSGLRFSASKCQAIFFRCSPTHRLFTLNDSPINISHDVRDLGIRYSCIFSFSKQIGHQTAKARRLTALICRSLHTKEAKIATFKQIVRPLLEFCPIFSSHYTQKDRAQIERVQRSFTRWISPNSLELSYSSRCLNLGLEPLWLRRLKLNLAFFHRIIHGLTHSNSYTSLQPRPCGYPLRNRSIDLHTPLSRTKFHELHFLNLYPRIWNKLPADLRGIENHHIFAKRIKSYLTVEEVYKHFKPHVTLNDLYTNGIKDL